MNSSSEMCPSPFRSKVLNKFEIFSKLFPGVRPPAWRRLDIISNISCFSISPALDFSVSKEHYGQPLFHSQSAFNWKLGICQYFENTSQPQHYPGRTWAILIVHFKGPSQLLIDRARGCHVGSNHELLRRSFITSLLVTFSKGYDVVHIWCSLKSTLKSMYPLESLSNTRNMWSTKAVPFWFGKIIEYIFCTFDLFRLPSGQSNLKALFIGLNYCVIA